ncbi:MAG TPA: ABC transporter ATP-binding protein [Pirellulaceae bacterium]|nr:ABC transporter ATP-binding protein [Pirellulaceae bacterium]
MHVALRAFRLALRYPLALGSAIGLTFLIAALWGGNIAAVYPILEVAFQGQSLQDWSAQRIAKCESTIAEHQAAIARLQNNPPPRPELRTRWQYELDTFNGRLAAEKKALEGMRRLHPWIVRYLPRDPFQTVALLVALIVSATAFKNACIVANLVLTSHVARRVTMDLRQQFFERVLRCDMRLFSQRSTGQLWPRFIEDIPHVAHGITTVFGRAIGEPLKIFACLVGAGLISWRLLLVSLVLAPPAMLLIGALSRSLRRVTMRAYDKDVHLNGLLFETLQGLPIVQAFTMETAERQRLDCAALRSSQHMRRVAWLQALTKPAVEVLGIGAVSVALLAGAYLVLNQQTHLLGFKISDRPLSLSALLIFYAMLLGASEPLRRLSDVLPTFQLSLAAAERLFTVLDEPPTIVEPRQARSVARPHQCLELDDVSFHYTAKRPVLRGVSLKISHGEVVAIVGANGCGKSTLVNLIPRFYDTVKGAIRLDGISLSEMSLRDLRERIGIVTQHSHLFDNTVLENIRYGSPGASDEQVFQAARQAFADEFITTQLAHGYETRVGHAGASLSGGQRQRIALARAILRNPEILILDEPTSQIDLVSERLIQQSLQEFAQGRTVILITHRLSLLALARRILVMQRGQIVAEGTQEELLNSSPLFREICDGRSRKAA